MAFIRPEKGFSSTVGTISRSKGHFEGWVFVVLAHAFLALLESRRGEQTLVASRAQEVVQSTFEEHAHKG